VLFTSAIMCGFRDSEGQEHEDLIPPEDLSLPEDLSPRLSGMQFSLLLYRYLKDTRSQVPCGLGA
jgi:hypothetical protein